MRQMLPTECITIPILTAAVKLANSLTAAVSLPQQDTEAHQNTNVCVCKRCVLTLSSSVLFVLPLSLLQAGR